VSDSVSTFKGGVAGEFLLICPCCAAELVTLSCGACGAEFLETLGIPDLRWPRADRSEREIEFINSLVARFDTATFDDLSSMVRRYHFRDCSDQMVDSLERRAKDPGALGQRMLAMFAKRLSSYSMHVDSTLALDVGCGYGTATLSLARQFNRVMAIDPDLPVLVLAKKFLKDHHVDNVMLIQARAQRIPLRSRCISYAVAQNVIEHLFDVTPALQEIERVLAPQGCFCGDSRNRYDLFFPEPHVHVRWVGVFPRALQSWYVRRRLGVSYEDAHARLLSLRELKKAAREAFGRAAQIALPLVSAYGKSTAFDKWIERIDRIPVVRQFVLAIFPSHLLMARVNSVASESDAI
jgi:ubiquinone/menaquinone biosynthesis C-methylase UbiE